MAAHTPVEIVPTDVSEEETTPVPRVLFESTDVPLIKYALEDVRFALPDTSKAYVAGVLLIPTKLLVVSTTKIPVPSAFCNEIAVVALVPGLITTEAGEV